MAKHTPGPWVAIFPETEIYYQGANITEYSVFTEKTRGELNEQGHSYREDVDKVDNIRIASQFQYDLPLSELQANARLIAAAPELLEACKEALEFMKNIANYGRLEKLRRAIAKAEGVEQDD